MKGTVIQRSPVPISLKPQSLAQARLSLGNPARLTGSRLSEPLLAWARAPLAQKRGSSPKLLLQQCASNPSLVLTQEGLSRLSETVSRSNKSSPLERELEHEFEPVPASLAQARLGHLGENFGSCHCSSCNSHTITSQQQHTFIQCFTLVPQPYNHEKQRQMCKNQFSNKGLQLPLPRKGLAGDLDITRVNTVAPEQFRELEKQWNKT